MDHLMRPIFSAAEQCRKDFLGHCSKPEARALLAVLAEDRTLRRQTVTRSVRGRKSRGGSWLVRYTGPDYKTTWATFLALIAEGRAIRMNPQLGIYFALIEFDGNRTTSLSHKGKA
jgi:hypothetical protein